MLNFKFRLETVLEVKRGIEDICKKNLFHFKNLLIREQDSLKNLEHKKVFYSELLKDAQIGVIDVNELLNHHNYLTALREKITSQISLVNVMIDKVEKKRTDLIAASKEKKIIEKLKENQYEKFKKTTERQYTGFLDDLANSSYTHKKLQGL